VDIGTTHRETAAMGGTNVQTFEAAEQVTVYWRSGCSSCTRMLRGLRSSEVAFEEVNIWNDPSGAATVRAGPRHRDGTYRRGRHRTPRQPVCGDGAEGNLRSGSGY
jgi:hypothetical protein